MAYIVKVGEKIFTIDAEINKNECDILLNGKKSKVNISKITDRHFSLIVGARSFDVIILDNSTISVNGELFNVLIEDEKKAIVKEIKEVAPLVIKADMPGLIVDVKVKEGDNVNIGTPLLIIEAMKMQNEIKAQKMGKVKRVKVKKGDVVNAGDELLILE